MVVPQLPINDRSCHKSPWHEFRRETPTHGKILRFGRVGPIGPPRHIAPNNPSLVEVRHQRERFLIPGDLWKMQPIMENSLITRNMDVEILSAYSNLYTVDIYQCIFNLLLYLNIGCRVTNTCTNNSNHFLFHKNQLISFLIKVAFKIDVPYATTVEYVEPWHLLLNHFALSSQSQAPTSKFGQLHNDLTDHHGTNGLLGGGIEFEFSRTLNMYPPWN